MALTIALATRQRAEMAINTIERTLMNVSLPDTKIVVLVDDDDPESIEALSENFPEGASSGVVVSVNPRDDSVGAKFNRAIAIRPAEVYLAQVDYTPHVVYGFDQRILEAAELFPDKIGVVYNHMANLSFPEINAVTHRMAAMMGDAEHRAIQELMAPVQEHPARRPAENEAIAGLKNLTPHPQMYPEHFPYWFIDHWLDDLAHLIDRIAFADVFTDSRMSQGRRTHELRDPTFWANFYDDLRPLRGYIARHLIGQMHETEWRKKLLCSGKHYLVEERSKFVNDYVRDNAKGMVIDSGAPGDGGARYHRLLQRAIRLQAELLPKQVAIAA